MRQNRAGTNLGDVELGMPKEGIAEREEAAREREVGSFPIEGGEQAPSRLTALARPIDTLYILDTVIVSLHPLVSSVGAREIHNGRTFRFLMI